MLLIWDTAGQFRFRNIISSYFRGVNGIILVYDITDLDSFNNLKDWLIEIEKNAPKNVNKILVGNKCDMDNKRKITIEQGREFALEWGMKFFEISAKDSKNISEVFETMAKDIILKYKEEELEEREKEEEIQADVKEKKCSLDKHENEIAKSYCQECGIYMCKKCEEYHSNLFNTHHPLNFNLKNINEIFTGICKVKNHSNKLQYFCRTHNKLCCVACISIIRAKGNGFHKNCNVCLIEDIREEKKNLLQKNIEYLEKISNNMKKEKQ